MTVERIKYGDETDHWMSDELGDGMRDGVDDIRLYIARESETCHDCAAERGEYHTLGCDVEQCPVCKQQLLGCEHQVAE